MGNNVIKKLNIANLVINPENFRHNPVKNQKEAINMMVKDQKVKLYKLAKDISVHGLNPSELIIVVKLHNEEKLFLVLEGNRRITSLKLINQPELLDDIDYPMKKKFKQLNEEFKSDIISTISCVVFENEKDAYKWINLKHTGENKGVGVVKWDSASKARFKAKIDKKPTELQVIDYIKKNDAFNENVKKKIDGIYVTNLQRLIDDPDVREAIGIDKIDGEIKTTLPDSEIAKGLTKIICDLADENINVKDIYYKEDRLNYINKFTEEQLPNKSQSTGELRSINNIDNENELLKKSETKSKNKDIDNPEKDKRVRINKRVKRVSTNRKYLIPSDFSISIKNKRINDIFRELKGLEVKNFENSVAVLFRVFIELSADEFIEKKQPKKININSKLKSKIQKIAEYMKDNEYLDKYQLKPINKAVSSEHGILSVDTFNSYVHNKDFYPSPNELKIAWNNFQIFIQKTWEIIGKAEK